jgi:MFS family permease
MNTVASTLAMFSPYIAGTVIEIYGAAFGMRILYGLLAAAIIISATINLRYLKETSTKEGEKVSLSDVTKIFKEVYGGIPSMLAELPRSVKALGVVLILLFMCNGVASPFWVVYAVERIGLSSVEWGLILLVEAALKTLLYIPAGMIVDRYGRTRSLLASLLLTLVSIPFFVYSTRFIEVLLIRMAVAVATVFFIPASSALMADTVPRESRGRVMAAFGRGSVLIGAAGGGTGGPGMGFFITIPVMIASVAGGLLYSANPAFPWFFVLVSTAAAIIMTALFIRDPTKAEV